MTSTARAHGPSKPASASALEQLSELIETSGLAVGDRLPGEKELASRVNVSRATVRDALTVLERLGKITRRPGMGTFIAESSEQLVEQLGAFESVTSIAASQAVPLESSVADVSTKVPPRAIAAVLGLAPDESVRVVERTLSTRSGPAIHMVDYVPVGLLAHSDNELARVAVLRPLLLEAAPEIQHVDTEISVQTADAAIAAHLDVRPGFSVLVTEETLFTEAGRAVETSRNYYNPLIVRFRASSHRSSD